jgi:protein O-GlcNAc transferase
MLPSTDFETMGSNRKRVSNKRNPRKDTLQSNDSHKRKLFWFAAPLLVLLVAVAYFGWRHSNNISDSTVYNTEHAQHYHTRGIELIQQNRLVESLSVFDECSSSDPSYVSCYNSKAGALRMLGRQDEGIRVLQKGEEAAIQKFGKEYTELGILYQSLFLLFKDLHRTDEAVEYIQKSIALQPNAKKYYNWATLDHLHHATKVELYNKALQLEPEYFPAFCQRAHSYTYLGEWEALQRDFPQLLQYQQALIDSDQQHTDTRTCLLPYHTTYMNISASMMRDTAIQFAQREATLSQEHLLRKLHPSDVQPVLDEKGTIMRRLRIGYVSSDFNKHPVGRNMLGVFLAHDKTKFDVFAFATKHLPNDQITQAMYSHVSYVDISAIRDYAMAARKIRDEFKIDVLIDLNGWTTGNRLRLFAARPAPVQVAHGLGFVGTIGAPQALDYFISDIISSPRRFDEYYTEKLVRLPQAYLPASHKLVHITNEGDNFQPATANKTQIRIDNELPSDSNTFVFCAFQGFHRISQESFETWMRILNQTNSVLWTNSVQDYQRERVQSRATQSGIENVTRRILFSDGVNPGDNLIRAQACDLHLDNWPYTAHSTGMDVLWAGVPLLVYLPDYHDETSDTQVPKMASRVSAGLLHTLGMPQLITSSVDDFEALATRLATDRVAYTKLRNELLEKRQSSPLFDVVSYTRVHEQAYLHLFQLFYDGKQLEPFDVPPFQRSSEIKAAQIEENRSKDDTREVEEL